MKILVVVDVQKEFNKFIQYDLVDELYEYAETFKKVYQIWDTHKNDVAPTYKFPNEVKSVKKRYGKSHFSDKVKEFIKEVQDETFEGNVFKLKKDVGYIVRVDNNHDWFYVNPEIVELIEEIKNNKIILVGGADNECLEDVYQAFKAFGLNVHINKKYVYSAKTSNKNSINEKIHIPNNLSKKDIINNIKKYPYDYILIKLGSRNDQLKLLDLLKSLSLFIVTDFFEENKPNIYESYWVIPLKENLPYEFLRIYQSNYNYAEDTIQIIRALSSKKLLYVSFFNINKIEIIFSEITGCKVILNALDLYKSKKTI